MEMPRAIASSAAWQIGDFVQLAGRKTKGRENRELKKATIPKARTLINTIRGHFGLCPVKGKRNIWRTVAGSYLIQ
jgi:hypothetical protein